MNTLERFIRLMSGLDPSGQADLLLAAKRLLDASGRFQDGASESPSDDAAQRIQDGLDQVMDLIEANACLEGEYESGMQTEGQDRDDLQRPDRLLVELEIWVEANRRRRPRRLAPEQPRSRTVNRLQALMPSLDSLERDSLVDAASRLTRSWRSGWSELEPWERTIGVWRILCPLNEQMDAMERGMKALLEFEAAEGGAGGAVTRDLAIEIATQKRNLDPTDLPDGWTCATKVTEEPPPGLYRVWEAEPAWYVWFLPSFFGLASSEVLVVSKRTGQVIGRGSACDEG